jgi:proteasome lid subunit RPN8/RPN11
VIHVDTNDIAALEMARIARATPDVEVCGLLARDAAGRLHVVEGKNLHPDPKESFVLDGATWVRAKKFGQVVAVWHSHPCGDVALGPADRVAMQRLQLPWAVVVPDPTRVAFWTPETTSVPLWGRPWRWGYLDCLALVLDWYHAEWGLELPETERPTVFPASERNYMRMMAEGYGFRSVLEGVRRGDLLIMRFGSKQDHLAVHLGDGMIGHHQNHRLSLRETYTGALQRRTDFVMRYFGPKTRTALGV